MNQPSLLMSLNDDFVPMYMYMHLRVIVPATCLYTLQDLESRCEGLDTVTTPPPNSVCVCVVEVVIF